MLRKFLVIILFLFGIAPVLAGHVEDIEEAVQALKVFPRHHHLSLQFGICPESAQAMRKLSALGSQFLLSGAEQEALNKYLGYLRSELLPRLEPESAKKLETVLGTISSSSPKEALEEAFKKVQEQVEIEILRLAFFGEEQEGEIVEQQRTIDSKGEKIEEKELEEKEEEEKLELISHSPTRQSMLESGKRIFVLPKDPSQRTQLMKDALDWLPQVEQANIQSQFQDTDLALLELNILQSLFELEEDASQISKWVELLNKAVVRYKSLENPQVHSLAALLKAIKEMAEEEMRGRLDLTGEGDHNTSDDTKEEIQTVPTNDADKKSFGLSALGRVLNLASRFILLPYLDPND